MPAMETEKLLALLAQKGAVFLVRSGGVLLAFVVAWMLAGWVSRAAGRGLRRTHLDETLVSFASAFLR